MAATAGAATAARWSTSVITPELREFVATKFGSPEQIDVFQLLHRQADREWTAAQVAEALGTAPQSAGMRLFLLSSARLLAASAGGEASYRYASNPALDLLAAQLQEAYAQSRAAPYALLSDAPRPDPARDFADAFRLRKP